VSVAQLDRLLAYLYGLKVQRGGALAFDNGAGTRGKVRNGGVV
jgi:hypothetical protein